MFDSVSLSPHAGAYAVYLVAFILLFIESAFIFGFFLPGDTLLIGLGLRAANGNLSFALLILWCSLGATLGNLCGYAIGQRYGTKLFERPNSRFFKKKHLEQTQKLFSKYGSIAVVLARFIAITRTLVPTFAGVVRMEYPKFALYSIVGSLLWTISLILGSAYLGRTVYDIDRFILPAAIAVGVLLLATPLRYYLTRRGTEPPK